MFQEKPQILRYYYVSFVGPMGPGGLFFKGFHSPLFKAEFDNLRTSLARSMTMSSGGQMIPAESIAFLGVIELNRDEAASHFPADFQPLVAG